MFSHMLAAAALAATPAQDPSAGLSQRDLVIQFGVACNQASSIACGAARQRWVDYIADAPACRGLLPQHVTANSDCAIEQGRIAAAEENRALGRDVNLVALTETKAVDNAGHLERTNDRSKNMLLAMVGVIALIIGGTLTLQLSGKKGAPAPERQPLAPVRAVKKRQGVRLPQGRVEAYVRAAEAQSALAAAMPTPAPIDHADHQRQLALRAERLRRELARPRAVEHPRRDPCTSDLDPLMNCFRPALYDGDVRYVAALSGANAAMEHVVDEIIDRQLDRHDLVRGVVEPRHVCGLLDKQTDDMYVFFAVPMGWEPQAIDTKGNKLPLQRKPAQIFYARLKGSEVRQRAPMFGNKHIGDTAAEPALMPKRGTRLTGDLRGLPVEGMEPALRQQMIQALRLAAASETDDCQRGGLSATANALAGQAKGRKRPGTLASMIKPLHRTLRGYWEADEWRQHRLDNAPARPPIAAKAIAMKTKAAALTPDAIAA